MPSPGPKPNVRPSYDQLREENANLKRILSRFLERMDLAAQEAQNDVRRSVERDVIPIKKKVS